MVDVALQPNPASKAQSAQKRTGLHKALKRKSTAAFLMTLPLILLIALLVLYPAFYSLHLATLNKSMSRFILASAISNSCSSATPSGWSSSSPASSRSRP
jgi:multiple sugar transport system permease protein